MKKLLKCVLPAILIAGVAAAVWTARGRTNGDQQPTYDTVTTERKDLRVTVSGSGVLEPLTTVDVKANVAGEVTHLLVDTGDVVTAGQLLAMVDTTESETSHRQATANVKSALAKVSEARATQALTNATTPLEIQLANDALTSALARERQAEQSLEMQKQTSQASIRQAEEALSAAQARLASAEHSAEAQPALTASAIQQAEASLRAAQQSLTEMRDATHPRTRKQAEAAYRQAKANLDNAKRDATRQEELLAKGFVPQSTVDTARTAATSAQSTADSAKAALDALQAEQSAQTRSAEAKVTQLEAALAAAKTNAVQDDLAQRDVESARAAVRQAEAALDSAKANARQVDLRQAELDAARAAVGEAKKSVKLAEANRLETQVRVQQVREAQAQTEYSQAQLDRAAKDLADTTIYAPSDGVVIEKFVEAGSIVTSGKSAISGGTTLLTLADITRMFVLADVDEVDVGLVDIGQTVDLTIESFPDDQFTGTVTKVYPKGVEEQNVTIFQVKIALDFTDSRLRPGMTAEAVIVTAEKRDVLTVPASAIKSQDGRKLAFVLTEEGPQPREVETGLSSFAETEILSGLAEGDEVVKKASSVSRPSRKGGAKDAAGEGGPPPAMRMMKAAGR